MANYDWIPYLEGKYMTYYEIMAMIFSLIAIFFSFLWAISYLILSKWGTHKKLKNICLKMIFYCLSSVPLICQALDVLNLIEGILLMASILSIGKII